ncbi:acyl-CoA desaturase [Diplocarpon mali]|nr:acyl-CoA desaturase [Diplocarpon mali]
MRIPSLAYVHHLNTVLTSLQWTADEPLDELDSPRGHVLTPSVIFSEGYHNVHPEFPSRYGNTIQWHQEDPAERCSNLWKATNLAGSLSTLPGIEIEKVRVSRAPKKSTGKTLRCSGGGGSLEQLPLTERDNLMGGRRRREMHWSRWECVAALEDLGTGGSGSESGCNAGCKVPFEPATKGSEDCPHLCPVLSLYL